MNTITGKMCFYCKKDPGPKHNNPNLWNGFFDQATGIHVCLNCVVIQYKNPKSYPFREEILTIPSDLDKEETYNQIEVS